MALYIDRRRKMQCQAITFTGVPCSNRGCMDTDEDIHVCKSHKTFTLSKKEHILEMVEALEFKKVCDEFIEGLNREAMEGHEKDIPLRNKHGLIVDFALVDPEDYENVIKYRWCLNNYGYVVKTTRETSSLIHRFILGNPGEGLVIDHKDGNPLNNKRNNLRIVTYSENNQNRTKVINEGTISEYIGVYRTNNKWSAKYADKYLGNFDNKIDAAKRYDTYVLLSLGQEARTNGLVKYEDIKITLDNFNIKKERELPQNIQLINNLYIIRIIYKTKTFYASTKSLEEAKQKLKEFKQQISEIKLDEEANHFAQEIKRNKDENAIIDVFNNKSEKINEIIVDDDKWHELSKYKWYYSKNYYGADINGKKYFIHRYLMNAKIGDIVDHINGNTHDNRISNLRVVDRSVNNHNIKGRGSSKFRGVSYKKKVTIGVLKL